MADFEFTITDTPEMVDLEEYFNYLIMERCNEIYYKIISHDEEYQSLEAEIKKYSEELLRALPEPTQQEIMNEKLAGAFGKLEMLLPRMTYRQVLRDGARLTGWMEEESKDE